MAWRNSKSEFFPRDNAYHLIHSLYCAMVSYTGYVLRIIIEICSIIPTRLYRYVRLIVNCSSSWTFKSIPLPGYPTYTPDNFTYIILTNCREDEHDNFTLYLRICLATKPHAILVSTIECDMLRIIELVHSIDPRIQPWLPVLLINANHNSSQ